MKNSMLSTDELGKHNLDGNGQITLNLENQAFNESFD